MAKTKEAVYYRMGELSNGAVISQPPCNIEHKYHIMATYRGETVGILFKVDVDATKKYYFEILSLYKGGRNYFHNKYTYTYHGFVDSCIIEMLRKNYLTCNVY